MKKALFSLAIGGLGIGITEFVIMGLLPDIASNLNITIPEAGHLISAYAMGVVIGAPVLVLIAGNYPPKKLLIFLMLLFTLFNSLSAFATNYHLLLLTRFLSGLPHGAFFGVGAVVASRMAKKGKESQAVAVMFSGLTVANLAGVPLATYIGHHYSWHYTFALIGLVGVLTIISIKLWLPALPAPQNKKVRHELVFFKRLDAWLIILIIAIGFGGLFTWISYIAPLLIEVAHFSPNSVSYIMALAGLGMFVGNIIGGKLSDKYSPNKTAVGLLLAMACSLLVVHYTASSQPITLIMTFITGLFSFALGSPIQMLMINTAKGAEMLAAAVSQASFNIANALGAFLGGLPLVYGASYTSPELVGVAMSVIGAAIAGILLSHTKQKQIKAKPRAS